MERFRSGEFEGAAALHRSAASETERVTARLSALINAASADLEAGAYDAASRSATTALAEASARRHPMYEARALRIVRAAALRGGQAPSPRPDLVDAVARLEIPQFEGMFVLNEAVIAGEAGDTELALILASRSVAAFDRAGQAAPKALALAFAAACGDAVELSPVWEILDGVQVPDAVAQVVCLALVGGHAVPAAQVARARGIVLDHADDPAHQGLLTWRRMREILESASAPDVTEATSAGSSG